MFEYDEELKLKSLTIWGFDIETLDTNKIIHVPMHQYRITTKEQTMLYVENLQCCIGLYAYSNNFGFVAHINPKIMRGDDYELDSSGKAIRCRRIDDLKNEILQRQINEPINIGLSIGCTPLNKDYPTVKMIYDGINNLILELNKLGIIVEKIETQHASEFILNTENSEIILAKNNKKTRVK